MTDVWKCPTSTQSGYMSTVGRCGGHTDIHTGAEEFTRQTLNYDGEGDCRISQGA